MRPNYGRGNEGNGDLLQKDLCTVVFSALDPAAGHCWPMPLPETPGHSQASLAQSLVGKLFLSPGSWYTQGFVCALQVFSSPVLWSSVIKSHWPPRSNSLRVLSPFAESPGWASVVGPRAFLTVRDFLWYNCSAVCGSSARWLYGGASKEAYVTHCVTQGCCNQSPCPRGRPLLTRASTGDTQHSEEDLAQSLWGLWALAHTRFCFVWALQASLVGMGFDSKNDFAPPTILLGLLLCPWMSGVFFGGIQHFPVDSCSAVSFSFGLLAREGKSKSFYSTI